MVNLSIFIIRCIISQGGTPLHILSRMRMAHDPICSFWSAVLDLPELSTHRTKTQDVQLSTVKSVITPHAKDSHEDSKREAKDRHQDPRPDRE
mmetsp:Transcript_6848/g.15633  ORF Transcript_6848/g.15633 Transcript_6848/m.15633 type:complete len:93 (+) Transcript_6848:752-1030(+)